MTTAPDASAIRQHTFDRYVRPARAKSEPLVIVRSGDVAAQLGMTTNYPQICGAIGATTFETDFRVRRVYLHGPINGANTYFVFDVDPAV